MTQEERLKRLSELSGRVGKMRTPYSDESQLLEMGAINPDFDRAIEELAQADDTELEWLQFNGEDPRWHNCVRALVEPLPDGLRHRLVTREDIEEDEPVMQVPLHNCLAVWVSEGNDVPDNLERREAVKDFWARQCVFLDRWMEFHGPLPEALYDLLLDFEVDGPPVRCKLALWVLWLHQHCDSPYWREALEEWPKPEDMPHMEFATDDELTALQWLPYAVPAGVRREALREFYNGFFRNPIVMDMGWEMLPFPEPDSTEAAEAEEAAGDEAEGTGEEAEAETEGPVAEAAEAAEGSAAEAEAEEAEAAEPSLPPLPLKPPPSFERFLWAYCNAEARTLGNGQRVVLFPQADPQIYTHDRETINCTLAVVADEEGPIMDEFAVIAALTDLPAGTAVASSPPFMPGPAAGGGGTSSQLHTQFGVLPEPGGFNGDIIDLEPENGSTADDWLKRLLGQDAATDLDMISDPGIRHMLDLEAQGRADMDLMPHVGEILPPLQLPKLWGPGLVAGVKRLRLEELLVGPDPEALEAWKERAAAEAEQRAEADAALARQVAVAATASGYDDEDELEEARLRAEADGEEPPPLSYDEYARWHTDMNTTTIEEVPADESMLETPEGRAEWRRMQAAWHSIPRVVPSTREHGRCMEAALAGAPLAEVFPSRRDLTRELAAADTLLHALGGVLEQFPTTVEQDEQLLEAAAAAPAGAPPAPPTPPPAEEIDPEVAATPLLDIAPEVFGVTPVTTLRMRGIVAWRRELKSVWLHMVEMIEEYSYALAQAEEEAGPAPPEGAEGAGEQDVEGMGEGEGEEEEEGAGPA